LADGVLLIGTDAPRAGIIADDGRGIGGVCVAAGRMMMAAAIAAPDSLGNVGLACPVCPLAGGRCDALGAQILPAASQMSRVAAMLEDCGVADWLPPSDGGEAEVNAEEGVTGRGGEIIVLASLLPGTARF
jgi:hypothetical protein